MPMWSKISRVLGGVETIAGIGLLGMATAVLFVNVILRYFFGQGFSWAEEMIAFSMIWVTFLGAIIAARKKSHVAMTIVLDSLKDEAKKRVFSIIILVITVVFCILITYLGAKQIVFLAQVGQTSAAMRLPMYIPYLAIPFGFGLMAIRFTEQIAMLVKLHRASDGRR